MLSLHIALRNQSQVLHNWCRKACWHHTAERQQASTPDVGAE